MTAHVLVAGTLFREPEQRTSKAGKPFVAATIRAKDGKAAQWWRLIAFVESAEAELMRLTDGDELSVSRRVALRKLGFKRERRWHDGAGFSLCGIQPNSNLKSSMLSYTGACHVDVE
jgi:hypothetical protein